MGFQAHAHVPGAAQQPRHQGIAVDVAAHGYSVVDQEYEAGMCVLGVPLTNRKGELKATLTITTHASRMSGDEMRQRYLTPLYEAQALLKPVLD
ncbi:Pca regulon regulatory protein [compost metagenome]